MKISKDRLRQVIKEEVSRAFPYMLAEKPDAVTDEPSPASGTAAAIATSDDPQYPPSAPPEKTPLKINSLPYPREVRVNFGHGWESVEKSDHDKHGRSFYQIDVDSNSKKDIKIKIRAGSSGEESMWKILAIPQRYNPRRGVYGGRQELRMCWDFDEGEFCEH